jgi:glutathione synthase
MRFLYVMDPMDRVLPDKDTTFAFLRAGQARGHVALHAEPRDVYAERGEIFAQVRPVVVQDVAPFFTLAAPEIVPIADLDAVFIRKDPPFDAAYLYLTLLLERLRGRTLVLNDPRGLRDANEKLYALHFAKHMPATMVASNADQIFAFVTSLGGQGVIKPLDGAGGSGVMLLTIGDKNARAIVETLTGEGKRLAMIQEYLPGVLQGDKRILLMDGEILGAINRIARADDLRSNIHVGGRVEACDVTAHERALVAEIAPRLRADGLIFVGLDVIGGKLTEVNVTSPTGIQELSRHRGEDVASRVIAWVEQHAKSYRVQPTGTRA